MTFLCLLPAPKPPQHHCKVSLAMYIVKHSLQSSKVKRLVMELPQFLVAAESRALIPRFVDHVLRAAGKHCEAVVLLRHRT